jgi:hypothetical protein
MERNEITPAPVNTAEELIAKMDLILGAAQQWVTVDDDELGAAIYRRCSELPANLSTVQGSQEHWAAFNEKAVAINRSLRQKAYVELQNMNSLN